MPFSAGFVTHFIQFAVFGAQNIFVLRHSIGVNAVIIPFICFLIDAFMVYIMMFGFMGSMQQNDFIFIILKISGSIFLIYYGIKSILNGVKASHKSHNLVIHKKESSFKEILFTSCSVSILNPGAWIDTFTITSIGRIYENLHLIAFYAGTVCAAAVWFAILSICGKMISRLIQKPVVQKYVDFITGATMIFIAIKLGTS